jgi:hypothetical protein
MYAPAALSSRASVGSTSDILVVTFFALSLGTADPQLLQYIVLLLPFPPFERPRLFLFLVKSASRPACLFLFKPMVNQSVAPVESEWRSE